VPLPDALEWTAEPDEALAGAEAVVMVVPSKYVRATLGRFAGAYRAAGAPPVVSATKGFDETTRERMTEILSELWSVKAPAALSGPSIAPETRAACRRPSRSPAPTPRWRGGSRICFAATRFAPTRATTCAASNSAAR
jgi:glycerol-3-phosphate dehydrogenase